MIWILVVCAIISAALREWADLVLIVAVVVLNVAIGLAQEAKAAKASQAIQKMLQLYCTALRGGERRTIRAADLVVGDVICLAAGDRVPADARIVVASNLQV